MKRTIEMILMTLIIIVIAWFVGLSLTSCSSDSEKPIPVYDYHQFSFEEQFTITTENGLTIRRDESGRVTDIQAFLAGQDELEKLMNAPSSMDDIRHLFPLSEDNEIRLTNTGENPAIGENANLGELAFYPQYYEDYSQYYKNVLVDCWCRINYFGTPQGKRMSYTFLAHPFIDVKNLNPKPDISEKQARQVLADYLEVERDDNWPCYLLIKEYSTKKDEKILRDVRLIYSIQGPPAPTDPNLIYFMAPTYRAEIDAHTSQLLIVSY